jgi:hypothetical protein
MEIIEINIIRKFLPISPLIIKKANKYISSDERIIRSRYSLMLSFRRTKPAKGYKNPISATMPKEKKIQIFSFQLMFLLKLFIRYSI